MSLKYKEIIIFLLYPRDSNLCSVRGFVHNDNGSMAGSHWTACYVKNNKSF